MMCCYIARCYVKRLHVRLGVLKHIFPLSWGGGGGEGGREGGGGWAKQNRSHNLDVTSTKVSA